MAKQVIVTPHPPKFHYSAGIKTKQFIFAAAPGHEDPDTGEAIKGVEAQTRQCLETIKEVLEAADSSLSDIVSTTMYLVNADDFLKMNETYKEYFPKDPPARATIITELVWPSMLVEIQCIACHQSGQ